MPGLGTAYIEVKPDLSNFGRSLSSDIKRSTSGLSSMGKTIGKGLAIGIGAGLAGVGVFIKGAVEEAQEALQLEAQTAAVIKSTRGAANITSIEIDKLTGSIQGYAAISDETVRKGANMLLTFKNIRNEAGKGNDVFNQSTEALIDMSVAMGKEPSQAAIMLGKALNDPIKGLSAMSRVGIQFTEGQENQIQAMVDANDIMGAQKIILKELESQFGGSARAVGNTKPWEKLKLAIGEIQEGIGKALMPTINEFAKDITKFTQSEEFQAWIKDASRWLSEELPKAIDFTADAFRFMARNAETLAKVVGGALTFAFGVKLLNALSAVRASMATLGLAKLATSVGAATGGGAVAGTVAKGVGGAGLLAKGGPWALAALSIAAMAKQAKDAESEIASLTKEVERFGLKSDKGALAAFRATDEVRNLGASSLGLDNTFGNVNAAIGDVNKSLADANRRFMTASLGTEEFNDVMERARDVTGDQRQKIGQLITRVVNLQGPLNDNIKSQLRTNLYWGEGEGALSKLRGELQRAEKDHERNRAKVDEHAEGIHTLDRRVQNLGVSVKNVPGSKGVRFTAPGLDGVHNKVKNLLDFFSRMPGSLAIQADIRGSGIGGGFGPSMGLVGIGQKLLAGGFRVSEHPAFGGVGGGHSPTGYHPAGRAIDVNWGPPGQSIGEQIKLNALGGALRQSLGGRIRELFFPAYDPVGGHQDHLHLAMAKGGEGIVRRPTTFLAGEAGAEHFQFTPLNGGRHASGTTFVFSPTIYADSTTNGKKLVRVIRAEFHQMIRQADRLAMT